jgi:protein tyrosine/serine phosphatase
LTRRAVRRFTLGWRRSAVDRSPDWVRRAFAPSASYLDMLFVDHGVFRLIYVNRHRLGERAWRSAQPAPHQIRGLARDGVRTIVNLRGERLCGSYWLERDACRRYGIELVNFKVRSRAAPSREELLGARGLFERVQYPMLMHCKSGADRAGLMSALYLFTKEGVPLEQARKELSLRFGHVRQADTGILDYFFERYLEDNARRPIPFFEWVETVYDPDELKQSFMAKGWANRIVDSVLRRE